MKLRMLHAILGPEVGRRPGWNPSHGYAGGRTPVSGAPPAWPAYLRRHKLPTLYDPVYARFDNILHFYFEYVI